jgi:hypothetical protein
MATTIALILIVLGALVLLFGKRVFVLAAGVGALLGVAFVNFLPGQQTGVFALLLIFGLAIAGGILGFFIKGLSHILVAIIGFLAGGAITLAILNSLGTNSGLIAFGLAVVGGIIGWVLADRFFDWGLVILAALTGALLVTRGLQFFSSTFAGVVGTISWILLAILGFLYQSRIMRGRK